MMGLDRAWSVVLVATLGGCTSTVIGGSEAGGGIQDPEGSEIVDPVGVGGAGSTAGPSASAPATSSDSTSAGSGGAGAGLPGPPDFGGAHREASCDPGTSIALVTQDQDVLSFDPATGEAELEFELHCSPGSMAMDADGALFVEAGVGVLRKIDPATGLCHVPEFVDPDGFNAFSLGFVGDAEGASGRLILADMSHWDPANPLQLAAIDIATGALEIVGDTHPKLVQMELTTGAVDGVVGFGGTDVGQSIVFEVDVNDASVMWTIEVPSPGAGNSFAAARWGDFIYMFIGDSDLGETDVSRLDLATGVTEHFATIVGHAVIGAGTPVCAVPR